MTRAQLHTHAKDRLVSLLQGTCALAQSAEVMRRELTARHEASVRGLLTLLTARTAAVQQQVASQTVLASLPFSSV